MSNPSLPPAGSLLQQLVCFACYGKLAAWASLDFLRSGEFTVQNTSSPPSPMWRSQAKNRPRWKGNFHIPGHIRLNAVSCPCSSKFSAYSGHSFRIGAASAAAAAGVPTSGVDTPGPARARAQATWLSTLGNSSV